MANLETQVVDDIILRSRRKMLSLGTTALAGLAVASSTSAKAQTAAASPAYSDNDILNFALNLEYLEANFYYLAAFGTTIDVQNAASKAAGAAVQGITGVGTQGVVMYKPNPQVPFSTTVVGSYAVETAIEEGKHVGFLRSTLGSAAVAQPQIDLTGGATFPGTAAWNTLATAAGIQAPFNPFDPFLSDGTFLIGAYVFEDVGVTAYHGAAPLLSTTPTGKAYLQAAAGILAVEAYHAGLVRTSILLTDPTNQLGFQTLTQQISTLRATLSAAAVAAPATAVVGGDDFGLATQTVNLGGSPVPATTIVDADPTNEMAFARTTTQVLNIVTGGGVSATAGTAAKGVFFPAGLNGFFK